jgi:hypothetical protein
MTRYFDREPLEGFSISAQRKDFVDRRSVFMKIRRLSNLSRENAEDI